VVDAVVDNLVLQQVNKPVREAVQKVFAGFGVEQQQYHSNSLIGIGSKRMFEHHVSIIEKAGVIFKDVTLRRPDLPADINDQIDKFLSVMMRMMAK